MSTRIDDGENWKYHIKKRKLDEAEVYAEFENDNGSHLSCISTHCSVCWHTMKDDFIKWVNGSNSNGDSRYPFELEIELSLVEDQRNEYGSRLEKWTPSFKSMILNMAAVLQAPRVAFMCIRDKPLCDHQKEELSAKTNRIFGWGQDIHPHIWEDGKWDKAGKIVTIDNNKMSVHFNLSKDNTTRDILYMVKFAYEHFSSKSIGSECKESKKVADKLKDTLDLFKEYPDIIKNE